MTKGEQKAFNIFVRINNGEKRKDIANEMGVSYNRVCQYYNKGLRVFKLIPKQDYIQELCGGEIRIYNALRRTGINSIDDLVLYFKEHGDFKDIRNLGLKSNDILYNNIKKYLK